MTEFKVGDKIRMKQTCSDCYAGEVYELGSEGIIGNLGPKGKSYPIIYCSHREYWELVENNNKSFMTNVITAVKNLFVTEPQKSLRATGIFDEQDTVTSDGMKVYLSWLIAKDTVFQSDIVAKLVATQEAEKNK